MTKNYAKNRMPFFRNMLLGCCSLLATAGVAAAQEQSSAQTPNPAQEDQSIQETIVVTGIRASLQKATDLKRSSNIIQDSIVAEDIGKFPDQNIAESLQRVTGVAISREKGEGSKITVRGFGPKFNLVQLNGRTMATVDRGREFDFQVLPAELINGADIAKTTSAKNPEGSLGAYVNTRTARPLDNPGLQLAGSIQTRYQDLAESYDPKASFSASNTFANDTIGVLFAAAFSDTSHRIDSFESSHWARVNAWQEEPGAFSDANGNAISSDEADGERLWYPGRARYSLGEEERTRLSGNLTLQWAPTDNFVSTFDAFYSNLEQEEFTNGLQIPLQISGWRDALVSENRTVIKGRKDGSLIDGLFRLRGSESTTQAFGWNNRYEDDDWTVEFDLSHSRADSSPFNNDFVPQFVNQAAGEENGYAYNLSEVTDPADADYIDFDWTAGDVALISSTIDWADPSSVRSHFNWLASNEREDEITETRVDINRNVGMSILESVDFGVRFTDRKKKQESYRFRHWCSNLDFPVNSPEWDERFVCNAAFDHTDSLFSVNDSNFLRDESGVFPRRFIAINDPQAYLDELGSFRQEPDWTAQLLQKNATVDNTEKTKAFYAQANLAGDFSDSISWSGNVGLRYVETKTTSSGFRVDFLGIEPNWDVGEYNGENGWPLTPTFTESPIPVTEEKSYDHLLPSANISVDFQNGLYVKAAASQVITRPALEDIGVNRNYNYNRAEFFGSSGGNPNLDPYLANQFDLAVEYYAESGNAYAINYFYKNISDSISKQRELRDTGVVLPDYGPLEELFNGSVNLDGGTVQGIEVAALHYFDYLPSFWSGFGAQVNYTHLFTEKSDDGGYDPATGITTPDVELEGFSDDSFNVSAFYDRNGFQARIAYNWRSEYLKALTGASSRGQISEHVEAYGQVDASASYDINNHITITGEIINLTNESLLEYADIRERVTLLEYNGVRYQLGLRAKF